MNPARLVFPALRWAGRDLDDDVWPEVRRAVELGVGGFLVFGGRTGPQRELADRATAHAAHPLLFAADLERGAGQQLADATTTPPPAALAGLGRTAVSEVARLTAREARVAGINWILAPVADLDVEPENPIVGVRSFGPDPDAVAAAVVSWIEAAQAEGVLACAKHFPGHGRTTTDSHAELPVVSTDRDTLETDLTPFRAAIDAGVGSVMVGHVAYPALDPRGGPASLSTEIIALLRDRLGFDGLVATDALIMDAIAAAGQEPEEAAVAAVRAGCDVLLYPPSAHAAAAALEEALASGRLSEARVAGAMERLEAACRRAGTGGAPALEPGGAARALELAAASVRPLRGALPRWAPGDAVRVHLADDDADLRGAPDREAGAGYPGPGDRHRLEAALRERGVRTPDPGTPGPGGDLVAVFCDVRAWKGRAGLSRATRERVRALVAAVPDAVVVLFGHPRLADELRGTPRLVCAWSGEPLMQSAVARRLTRTEGR